MAVRRRHGPSVSRVCRGRTHVLHGPGHTGVFEGPRKHAQSHFRGKSTARTAFGYVYAGVVLMTRRGGAKRKGHMFRASNI